MTRSFVAGLVVTVAALAAVSCSPSGGEKAGGSGALIRDKSELKPNADPGPKAKLIMGGVIVPVDVKVEQSGDDFSLHLVNGGQDFETEQYKNPPDGFLLVNAAGETYAPPIPLLKFPMRIGDTWKWSGDMITGPASRKADAAIRTRDDKVDMGTPVDALLVEVDLSMYSGASQPATRRLAFWFVKGKGLVKREFGSSTSRVPNEAKTE